MDLTANFIINTYSVLLLVIVCFHTLRLTDKNSVQDQLYLLMLFNTILLLFFDTLSRFDGRPNTFYSIINRWGNFLVFLFNLVIPALWLLYVHYQVYRDKHKLKKLIYPLIFLYGINFIVLVLSQFNGWYYFIDENNIYYRGPLFLLPVYITGILLLASFIITIYNRKRLDRKHFYSLLFFPVLPLLCILLQILFYGVSLMLNGVALSLLVVFLNLQDFYIYTDYLTGVYNRKKLDAYLNEKIVKSSKSKGFSAILMDLNSFKSINDTYGHDTGDYVLTITAKLLKNSIGPNDFIARYGGDEFFILIHTTDDSRLRETIERIQESIRNYNAESNQLYEIGVGLGYAVYQCNSNMKADEFLKHLDRLMYEDKQKQKQYRS